MIHISNFCSGMPPGKVHELAFLWLGLPGPLLIKIPQNSRQISHQISQISLRKIKKNSPTSFCTSAGRIIFLGRIYSWDIMDSHVGISLTSVLGCPGQSLYHSNFLDYTSPLIFQELISVIISPPITPNKFWGFHKCNSQKNLHHPVLSRLGRIAQSFTPNNSQGVNWLNKFHLVYTRKFLGN